MKAPQFVFELLKIATPMPPQQAEGLQADAEEWYRTLGNAREGHEPGKLETQLAGFIKTWWFQTLTAIAFIWAKRWVLDYLNGANDEDEDEDEDDDRA